MAKLRIDQPDFRATEWTETKIQGVPRLMCECSELVEGRWEGFVAVSSLGGK